jgi:hypothetical protein
MIKKNTVSIYTNENEQLHSPVQWQYIDSCFDENQFEAYILYKIVDVCVNNMSLVYFYVMCRTTINYKTENILENMAFSD